MCDFVNYQFSVCCIESSTLPNVGNQNVLEKRESKKLNSVLVIHSKRFARTIKVSSANLNTFIHICVLSSKQKIVRIK